MSDNMVRYRPVESDAERFRMLCERLHGRGPDATYRMLREILVHHPEIEVAAHLWSILERYADGFPPPPKGAA